MINLLSSADAHTYFAIVAFILGGMVGSFLNVCVYRIPAGLSIVKPASRCPKCESAIKWYDNLPIVSWLVLGAKCRNCRAPISWQYPLVEAVTAVLFLLVFIRFGFAYITPIYLVFAASMVLVTFVDLTDWTIPDEVTIPGVPIGIAISIVAMFLPSLNLNVPELRETVFDSLLGVLVGGGILYGLDRFSLLVLGKPGMGFGDVKLNAMLGAFFGWKGAIMIIVISAFVGSFVGIGLILIGRLRGEKDASHYLPFGPYLAVAGLIVMFFGSDIFIYYTDVMMGGALRADF